MPQFGPNWQREQIGEGRFRQTVSGAPIAYKKNGAYRSITNLLGATGDPVFPIGLEELALFSVANKLAGQSPVVRFGKGQSRVTWTPLGTNNNIDALVSGNEVLFPGSWDGADLKFVMANQLLAKHIILKAGHAQVFEFRIDSHTDFDPITLSFGDFRILQPYLTKDGEENIPLTWAVTQQGGKYIFSVTLPPGDFSGWVLDPTIIIQPDSSTGQDTWIQSNSATLRGGEEVLRVGDSFSSPSIGQRSLVKFDYSSIPNNSIIDSALFQLYEYTTTYSDCGGCGPNDGDLNRLLVEFDEDQAIWADRLTGVAWNTAGADGAGSDIFAAPTDTVSLTSVAAQDFLDWDIQSDVQLFVNGTNNYGWRVDSTGNFCGGSCRMFNGFYSSNYVTDPAKRPKSTVEYTEVAATPAISRRIVVPRALTVQNVISLPVGKKQ